jgi:hypothetical protein
MVKALLAVLALTLPLAVVAAPAYQVDKRGIALGEAVNLTLNARPGTLEGLDLAPLRRNFEIRDQTLNHAAAGDSLGMTLYPLRAGHLSLALPGLAGRAPTVEVTDGSDRVPKVRFAVESAPAQPHVRQPFRLTVEACDDGGLLWKRPLLASRTGLAVRVLDEQQIDVTRDGARCTAHRWRWAVTPTAAGPAELTLPMLEAGKFGQPLRFPPPPAQFDVLPVPAWLPAEAAVGPVTVEGAALPASWPVDRPLAWRFTIVGGYSPSAVKTLLTTQLAGHPGFAHYSPVVEPVAADDGVAAPAYAVTVYVLPDKRGPLAFPRLAWPWFDPASGQMRRTELAGGRPVVTIFDPARQWLIRGGLGLVGLVILAFAARAGYRAFRWRRARRQGLARIDAAATPGQLAAALRAFRLVPDAEPAPTLGVWLAEMGSGAPGVAPAVARLEGICYGAVPGDVGPIRRELLDRLQRARRPLGRVA